MSSGAGLFQIRHMIAADLPQAVEIAQSLKDAPHWSESAWQSALDPNSARRRIVLVADRPQDGIVQGFIVASLVSPQAELESIAVAEASQRKGLGRRLFAALAAELRDAGIGEIFLEARASNTAALGLYQALGFRESGRRMRYYSDPAEDAILMSLRLQ
jgi:[ribosomal protein S18]-alanine N-acetyltransferase